MLLATSPIVVEGKSYNQCLDDLFKELVRRKVRRLSDPAGLSRGIAASVSNRSVERLYNAAKVASAQARAALDAQGARQKRCSQAAVEGDL